MAGNESGILECGGPPSFYNNLGNSPQQANVSGNPGAQNFQAGGSPGTSPQQNANTSGGSGIDGITAPNVSSLSSPGSGASPAGNNPVGPVSPGRVVCVPAEGSPGRMVVGGSPQGGGILGFSPPQCLNRSGNTSSSANTTGGSGVLNISIPNVSAVMADMSNLTDNSYTQSPGYRQAGPSSLNRSVPRPPSPQQACYDPQQAQSLNYPGRVTSPGVNNSYSFNTSGPLNRNITLEGTVDNILLNDSNIPAYQCDQAAEQNPAYWMQPGHVGFPLNVQRRNLVATPTAENAVYLAQSTPLPMPDRYRQPAGRYINASPIHPPTPAGPQNYSGYSFLNDSSLLEGNVSDWADPYRDRSPNYYSQQMPSTYSPPPRQNFPPERIIETPPRPGNALACSPDYRLASFFRTPPPQSPDYRLASFFRTPPPQRPGDVAFGSPDNRMASYCRTPPPQRPGDMSANLQSSAEANRSAGSPGTGASTTHTLSNFERSTGAELSESEARAAGQTFNVSPGANESDRAGAAGQAYNVSPVANESGRAGAAGQTYNASPVANASGRAGAAGQTYNASPVANASGRAGAAGCCGPPALNAGSPRGAQAGGPGGSPASARGELPSYLGVSPPRASPGGGPAGSEVLGGPDFNQGSVVSLPRRPPSIGNNPNMPSALDLFSSCFDLLLRRIMMGNMVPVVNDLIDLGMWPWRFCDCPQNQNRMSNMVTPNMVTPIAHSTPNPRNGTPAAGTYSRLFNGIPNPPFPPDSWLEDRENENIRAEARAIAQGFSFLNQSRSMPPVVDPTFLRGGAPPGPASPQQVSQQGNRSVRMSRPQSCPVGQRPLHFDVDNYGRFNASNPDFNGDSYY